MSFPKVKYPSFKIFPCKGMFGFCGAYVEIHVLLITFYSLLLNISENIMSKLK